MAVEQKWLSVPPQAFTSDGSTLGIIQVASTAGFKVKQRAVVQATGQPTIQVQIKRVVSRTQMIVGPLPEQIRPANRQQGGSLLSVRSDLSLYTVAAGTFVFAEEQEKSKLTPADIWQAIYEQEPTVGIRTVNVDQFGNFYGPNNPLPVAFDGTISVGNVTIQDDDGNEMNVNPNGSIDVNIVSGSSADIVKNTYAEASAVAAGIETTIVQYVVPLIVTYAYLQRISVSGGNVGRYRVFLNGDVVDTRRTYYGGPFNEYFEYATDSGDGWRLNPGDIVAVKILHSRPYVADFQARIQALEIA